MKNAWVLLILAAACVPRHDGNADALAFLTTFYPEAKSVTARCQTFDTDQNGYVSCTGKVDSKLLALECPATINDGCEHNTECRLARNAVMSTKDEE